MESGSERDPWRPSRGQLKAVAFLLLLAAAAVVPDKVVAARADADREAVAAADAVRLSLSLGGEDASTDSLIAVVSNDGPDPVHVLDVQVAGYETVEVDAEVASLRGRDLRLTDTAACGLDLLRPGGASVATLRVRTGSGQVLTRTAEVPGELWIPLVSLAQHRCGYLAPQDALTVESSFSGTGKDLRMRLTLRNQGKALLQVGYVTLPVAGVYATQVDAGSVLVPVGGRPVSVDYSVTADDCTALNDPQVSFGEQAITVEVTAYADAESTEVLAGGMVGAPAAPLLARVAALTEAVCGAAR